MLRGLLFIIGTIWLAELILFIPPALRAMSEGIAERKSTERPYPRMVRS